MAIAFDNAATSDVGAGTSQVLTAVTLAAGSRAYAYIRPSANTNVVSGVTDDKSGSWSFRGFSNVNSTGTSLVVYSCASCPGGSTTITVAQSSSVATRAVVVSYTGSSGDEGFAITTPATSGATSTASSSSVTTGGLNRRIAGCICPAVNATTIVPTGSENGRGTAAGRIQSEDIAQAAQGSYPLTWTFGATQTDWAYAVFALITKGGTLLSQSNNQGGF